LLSANNIQPFTFIAEEYALPCEQLVSERVIKKGICYFT